MLLKSLNGMNGWNFPLEVTIHILSYLPLYDLIQLTQVSQYFYKAAQDSRIIQHLSFSHSNFNQDIIKRLLKRSPCLKTLDLSFCNISDTVLDSIELLNLRVFKLKFNESISATCLYTFLNACDLLKELDLKKSISAVNDDVCRMISKKQKLIKLKCEMGYDITWKGLKHILDGNTQLKHLELIQCPYINVQSLGDFRPGELSLNQANVFGKMMPLQLKHLNISKCKSISDEIIWGISYRCPQLEFLDMSYCSSLTDMSLLFLHKLLNLKYLYFGACYLITDNGISYLIPDHPLKWKELF